MLNLKPNCEWCDKDLPPDSSEAHICTYECTFCQQCVHEILKNVCPNCGGGFCQRPVRPKTAYRTGVSLNDQPASSERINSSYSLDEISEFVEKIKQIEPAQR